MRTALAGLAALLAALFTALPAAKAQPFRQPALYPEGPVVIGEALYVAQMTAHKVTRLTADPTAPGGYRAEDFFERAGCGPTALAALDGDRLVILCHLEGALAITDRRGALLSVIRESADGVRLDSPNDVSADGAGGAVFSNAGRFDPRAAATGRVMRIAPDLTVVTLAKGFRYANGVAVDAERRLIHVSEHLNQRVVSLRYRGAFEVFEMIEALPRDAIAEKVSLEDPYTGPDGIEIAPDGALLVAIYGGGAFLRLAKSGLTRHEVETRYLCNLAVWNGRLALAGAYNNRIRPYEGLIELRPLP